MRNTVRKSIWIYVALVLAIASCKKDDYSMDNFDDDFQDQNDGTDGLEGEEGALTLYKVEGDNITKIRDYQVASDYISFQLDKEKHQQMWNLVKTLFPENGRTRIAEFEVFHGGGDLLGYVAPVDDADLSKWRFGLAIDAADGLETVDLNNFFTYVTIHEYGHIVTLNESQIRAGGFNNCNSFFTGEGCSNADSYLNKVHDLGWADISNEWSIEYDNSDLYGKYQTRFVSDYAATNPGEDAAEVFAYFITQPDKPDATTIANKKVRAFYDYPELVSLRDDIRSKNSETVARLAQDWNSYRSQFKFKCKRGCKHH